MERTKDWYEEVLDQGILEAEAEKNKTGWFSIKAIENIPYISYPNFTEEERLTVQNQLKNVLRISRNENNYKEVAITYNKSDAFNSICKVLGDYSSVMIMNDENTKNLLNINNENNNTIIISLHNHPNNSSFSISDLLVFTENKSIELMAIVNKNGEVSFLQRQKEINLEGMIPKIILDFVTDFSLKKNEWIKNNPSKQFSIYNIIDKYTTIKIVEETINQLILGGIYYHPYTSKDIELKNNYTTITSPMTLQSSILTDIQKDLQACLEEDEQDEHIF